jgi:RNA polymerase sigma-70 factor (ECF subfamily)
MIPYEVALHTPDDQLAARCRTGDIGAFAQLYAQYERLVFRYAYHVLGNRDDADDMLQETFVRAYQAIGGFRGQAGLHTWLLKICANLIRNHRRQELRRREISLEGQPEYALRADLGEGPQAVMERAQDTELLRLALQSLPPNQRELIALREYEGLSYQEISQVLGGSPITIRVKLFRARNRLKERFESLQTARS